MKKIEAQKVEMTCSKSQSWDAAGIRAGSPDSKARSGAPVLEFRGNFPAQDQILVFSAV